MEGTGTCCGGPDNGESTWSERIEGSQAWAGSPGASTAGTDYLAAAIASAAFAAAIVDGSIFDFAFNDLSFLPNWVAGNNEGLLLRTQGEGDMTSNDPSKYPPNVIGFHSSDSTLAFRPELIIDYTPIGVAGATPEPGSLALLGIAVGAFAFCRRRKTA